MEEYTPTQPATTTTPSLAKKLDRLAHYLLVATVFLLPLIVLPTPGLSAVKMATLAFGVFASLALWAVARLNEHRVVYPQAHSMWVALLLVVGYLASAIVSGGVIHSLIGFGFERDTVLAVTTFAGAFVTVLLTTKSVGHVMRLQLAALAAFVILGVLQTARLLVGADTLLPGVFSPDATATFLGSWNDLAVFSGVAVLMTLSGLALFSVKKMMRIGFYLVLVLALFLLVVVNLSVVWATLAVAAFFLVIFVSSDASYNAEMHRFRLQVPWKRVLPSIGVIAVSIAFLIAGPAWGGPISDTFDVAHVDVRPSWEGTTIVGSRVFQESPILGVGPNMFQRAWIEHKPDAVNQTNFWNADFNFGVGYVPSAFITGGLVVGLLWLLFFATLVHLGVRMFAQPVMKPAHRYVVVSSYVGVIYLWTLSVVYLPQTAMLAYTFILTGIAIAASYIAGIVRQREINAEKSYASGLAFTGVVFVIIVFSAGAFVVHAERFTTSTMLNRAATLANEGEFERARVVADRAPMFVLDAREARLKTNIGFAALTTILNEETTQENAEAQRQKLQEELARTLTAARNAIVADDGNYRNYLTLGDIYTQLTSLNIEGAYTNAIETYTQAQELNPNNPIVPMRLARVALANENLADARGYAQEALDLKSNYTDAHFLLSQIAIQEGNVQQAISNTEAAVVLQPNNTGLLFQLGVLHYNQENYENAVLALERAVALNPQYANALYFLGLAYDRRDNKEGALAAFERVAELNPENQQVQNIVTALENGKSAFDFVNQAVPDVVEAESGLPLSDQAATGQR